MRNALQSRQLPTFLLAGVVLALFGRALLAGSGSVISAPGGDVLLQFLGWREYGFSRLAAGDVPLWNPHTFSGQPFLGNWQTALFYPPNWLHLVLPTAFTITLLVSMHIYLAGLFCARWLMYRGFDPLTAALAGAVFMLSGPVVGRVFPGHLTWIAVVAWTPLVFLALDRLLDTGRVRHAFVGTAAVALMILAGYPQPVYITLLAAGVYLVLNLVASPHRLAATGGFAVIVALGGAIAAVQAWTGVETGLSSSRAGGTTFAYATNYAFPVQNLLLLVCPLALGGPSTASYGGAGFLWECWPYIGVVPLLTAMLGGLTGASARRRWSVTMILLFTVLALGSQTPLYGLAYDVVPGFSSFRAPGRFLLIPVLFATPLVAAGISCLLSRSPPRFPVGAVVTLALASSVALIAIALVSGEDSASRFRATPLFSSAVVLTLAAAALALFGRWKLAPYVLLVLSAVELTYVASRAIATGPTTDPSAPSHLAALRALPDRARAQIQDISLANLPLRTGHHGLSGYDPLQQKRLTEFLAASQGRDPRTVDEIFGALRPHPSWRLLRAAVVIQPDRLPLLLPGALPHALLVDRAELAPNTALRLARLMSPDFDPTKTVLLEEPPPWPRRPADPSQAETDPTQPASAIVTSDTGDTLTIDVSTPRLTMLVITDAYAPGWTATRSDTGETLPVIPADHVLRAVPLTPGTYTVTLEYRPAGWVYGRWVSLGSLALFALWGLSLTRRSSSDKSPPARPHTDPMRASSDSTPATSPPSPPQVSGP